MRTEVCPSVSFGQGWKAPYTHLKINTLSNCALNFFLFLEFYQNLTAVKLWVCRSTTYDIYYYILLGSFPLVCYVLPMFKIEIILVLEFSLCLPISLQVTKTKCHRHVKKINSNLKTENLIFCCLSCNIM